MKNFIVVLISFLFLGSISGLSAQTYYVTPAGAGSKTGTSWADAYDNVGFRTALKTATYGSQFWIAAGTYYTENNRDSSFRILNGVKLYGGFPATGSPTFLQRDWEVYPTVFNGDLNNDDLPYYFRAFMANHLTRSDNNNLLLSISSSDTSTLLDGLIFQNANSITGNKSGAVIYSDNSLISIRNCRFTLNSAYNDGGAVVFNGVSGMQFSNCQFVSNYAGGNASAAVFNNTSNIQINNCRFDSNYVEGNATIYNKNTTHFQFKNCSFTMDSSYGGASAVKSVSCSQLLYQNCTFTSNISNNRTAAIIDSGSSVIYDSSFFIRNTCRKSGSTVYYDGKSIGSYYPNLIISNCQFSLNDLVVSGNGIFIEHSTFNTAGMGISGAIDSSRIQHCTFNSCNLDGWAAVMDSCNLYASNLSAGDRFTLINSSLLSCAVTTAYGANVQLSHCSFSSSNCSSYNAALYLYGCSIFNTSNINCGPFGTGTIRKCKFFNNATLSNADIVDSSEFYDNSNANGILNCSNGSTGAVQISNCSFVHNTVQNAQYGVVYCPASAYFPIPSIANCQFRSNTGLAIYAPNVNVYRCIFDSNTYSGDAGAVYLSGGLVTVINNCIFTSNVSAGRGGAIYSAGIGGGYLSIGNSFFGGNRCATDGGALFAKGNCTLIGNVFFRNSAQTGGAVYCPYPANGSAITLWNNTFFNNTATLINSFSSPTGSQVRIYNSIFWNTFQSAYNILSQGNTIIRNSVIQNQTSSMGSSLTISGCTSNDPKFRNTTLLSGPDQMWGTADDGLSMSACSPSIDLGDSNLVSPSFTEDITVRDRIYGNNIDAGAYEYQDISTGCPDTLYLSEDTLYFPNTFSHDTVDLTSNRAWSFSSPPSWLSVSPASGTNNASIAVHALGNPGIPRSATLTAVAGTVSRNIVVFQAGYLGINEIAKVEQLILYPNPATSEVYISISANSVDRFELYDSKGMQVKEVVFEKLKEKEYKLNTSALSAGLYMLVMRSGAGAYYAKLIISR